MNIIPLTSVADLTAELTGLITANVVPIVGLVFFGVSVSFIMRWFNKAKKVKA